MSVPLSQHYRSINGKLRLATVWLAGLLRLPMSFLDLDEWLLSSWLTACYVRSSRWLSDSKEYPKTSLSRSSAWGGGVVLQYDKTLR